MPQRVHRTDARKFVAGVATLIVAGILGGIGISMQLGEPMPGKSYTYITAKFDNVGWLSPRAEVAENGVRIGQVDSITHRHGQVAIVRMRLEGDKEVYRDANAIISNASALGKRQIMLDRGTPESGPLGDRPIPTSRTKDSHSLDDIYSELDPQTRDALASSLRELGVGLAGHSNDLQTFLQTSAGSLTSLSDISATLADPQTNLTSLLESANRLAGRLATRKKELADLLRYTDDTVRAISVDNADPLAATLEALPATLRQARRGLNSLNTPLRDVRAAMTTLRPGGQALGEASTDLRRVLREAVPPLNKVPGVSDVAKPAVEDLTQTIADARPLLPRLTRTLDRARVLLHDLAPYAPDIGRWASEHDLLSGRVRPGQHYLSLTPILPGPHLLGQSLPDPTVDRQSYPEPGGGAWKDNAGHGTTDSGGGP